MTMMLVMMMVVMMVVALRFGECTQPFRRSYVRRVQVECLRARIVLGCKEGVGERDTSCVIGLEGAHADCLR